MYRTRSTKRLLKYFTMSHCQQLHVISKIMHTKFHASTFNNHRKIAPGVLVMYSRCILLLILRYIFIFRNHVLKQKCAANIKDNTHQIARFYLQQGIKYRTRSKKCIFHQEYKTPQVFATRPPKRQIYMTYLTYLQKTAKRFIQKWPSYATEKHTKKIRKIANPSAVLYVNFRKVAACGSSISSVNYM